MKYYVHENIASIAHRGYSGKFGDNNATSFSKAYARNFDMVELDIQACRTGELIIHHDLMLGHHIISRTSYDTLKKVSRKKLLTLRDFMERFPWEEKGLYLDLKGGLSTAYGLFAFIKTYSIPTENIIACSFNKRHLDLLKNKIPSLRRGFITDNILDDNMTKTILNDVHCYVMHWSALDIKTIQMCKQAGVLVYTYTMNTRHDLKYMRCFDIDGIITNYKLTKVGQYLK